MKTAPLLDAASANALSVAWLVQAVAPASEYGDRVFSELEPFAPGQEAAAAERAQKIFGIAQTVDSERLDAVRDALRGAPDAAGAIARASIGDVLTDAHLFELQRFCDALTRVDALLDGVAGVERIGNDATVSTARALESGRTGKFAFYLADSFDVRLAAARARMAAAQAELDASRGRAAARIGALLDRDDLTSDEFIVMRAGVSSLPAGVRVLREAPTYFLCALEYDDATLAALERRDAAADEVASAETAVRGELSSVVRARAAQLDLAARAFGEIDVLVAAARFAQAWDCAVPEIVAQPGIAFERGRFLPLAAELEVEGRAFTPIDVELHDVAVLTGPNMGGKSVCLRTCAFVALCAAFGIPVPATSARVGLFDEIAWLGIGGEDEAMGGLLSSFAKEVVRLRDVLERNAKRLFVLVDEFARTTTPHEGKALLVALIARLRVRGACGMLATHLGGVAREAGARHFAVRGLRGIPARPATGDLHAALASLAASMDYTIAEITGEDGSSADAIALAGLLGLDPELVADAQKIAAWNR